MYIYLYTYICVYVYKYTCGAGLNEPTTYATLPLHDSAHTTDPGGIFYRNDAPCDFEPLASLGTSLLGLYKRFVCSFRDCAYYSRH